MGIHRLPEIRNNPTKVCEPKITKKKKNNDENDPINEVGIPSKVELAIWGYSMSRFQTHPKWIDDHPWKTGCCASVRHQATFAIAASGIEDGFFRVAYRGNLHIFTACHWGSSIPWLKFEHISMVDLQDPKMMELRLLYHMFGHILWAYSLT